MNSQTYQRRLRSFSLRTIGRFLPLIIVPALLAGLAVSWAMGEESTTVVARQPMALRNVGWSDLASTHEANVAWLERNGDELLGEFDATVEVLPPENRQLSLFSIEAESDDEVQAVAALAVVTDAMASEIDPFGDRGAETGRLQSELDTATSRVIELRSNIETLRQQQIDAVNQGADSEVGEFDREIILAEIRLQQWDQRTNQLELQLAELTGSPQSSNQAIGDPEVRPPTVVSSGRIAGLLTTFVVGLGLVFAILTYARIRGPIRDAAHLGLLNPDIAIVPIGEDDVAPSVAFLTRMIATDARDGVIAIVDVSEKDAGRRVASLLHATLTRMSVSVFYPEPVDFDQLQQAIHQNSHGRPLVISPKYTGQILEATIALCTHVILVTTAGRSRAKEFTRTLAKVEQLQVKPLASVINAANLSYGNHITNNQPDPESDKVAIGDLSFNPRQTYDLSDLLSK